MGQIVNIYAGKDGHVQVVAIKIKTGTYSEDCSAHLPRILEKKLPF